MITNRLRGLLNLHIYVTTLIAAFLLLSYQNAFRFVHSVDLNKSVSIFPYCLCVVAGMLVNTHYLRLLAHRFHRLSWVDSARLTSRQTTIVAVFMFAFIFALKGQEMSRVFVGSYLLLLWCVLLFLNVGLPRFLCMLFFDRNHKIPTLFFGSQGSLEKLGDWLASKAMLGLCPVGFISEDDYLGRESAHPFLGKLSDLSRIIADKRVVQVIVLELPRSVASSQMIIEVCRNLGCRLLIYANLAEQLQHPLVTVNEEGYLFYALQDEPLEDPLNRTVKRLCDLVISILVVVLLLPPLMVWVWVMQRLQSRGPIFFVQERTGYQQKSFRILKFRSMHCGRERLGDEANQATRTDSRIYPFGKFLRKTSLDEFPQFINVLMGEMSVVGPRPHLVAHDNQFSAMTRGYRTRFFVKPGITGLAQCYGLRGEISDPKLLEKRIKFDLKYIAQWSFWLDVQLIVRTAWQVMRPQNSAY